MKAKKTLSALLMLVMALPVAAQMEITNTALDVEGEWSERPSAAKRAEKLRKRLQKKTNDMVDTQIETMRLKAEKQIGDQLSKALSGQSVIKDEVSTTQSSTIKKEIELPKSPKTLKVIPKVGFLSLKSETIDFDSKVNAGIQFESQIQERFAFGVGINFTSMNISDPYNTYTPGYYVNPYSYGYNNYGASYYPEREIGYRNASLELLGKFYLSHTSRVKPFIGLGVEYSRSELKYKDAISNQYYYYNSNRNELGGEKYIYSSFAGSVQAGAEMSFSDTIGLILDVKLAKGLNGQHSRESEAISYLYNPDLQRLEGIANEMSEATSTSVGVGLVVAF
ncbi:MAG: hypothetical protein ACO20H_10845 [Bacteriovoracaceae bacterium]